MEIHLNEYQKWNILNDLKTKGFNSLKFLIREVGIDTDFKNNEAYQQHTWPVPWLSNEFGCRMSFMLAKVDATEVIHVRNESFANPDQID